MYENEDFYDVPQDVLDIVDKIESVLDGTYDYDDDTDYQPLNFNDED